MAEYAVTFARSARKELESLPPGVVERIWPRIGDYRVVYSVDDRHQNIDVVAVRHRKDAYR